MKTKPPRLLRFWHVCLLTILLASALAVLGNPRAQSPRAASEPTNAPMAKTTVSVAVDTDSPAPAPMPIAVAVEPQLSVGTSEVAVTPPATVTNNGSVAATYASITKVMNLVTNSGWVTNYTTNTAGRVFTNYVPNNYIIPNGATVTLANVGVVFASKPSAAASNWTPFYTNVYPSNGGSVAVNYSSTNPQAVFRAGYHFNYTNGGN